MQTVLDKHNINLKEITMNPKIKEILETVKNNFNQYFIQVLKTQYFDYKGRSNLAQFWNYYLYSAVVGFIIGLILGLLHIQILALIAGIALFIPGICIGIRRLHDLGLSGLWYLIVFIPFIGSLSLLLMFSLPGEKSANAYGEAK